MERVVPGLGYWYCVIVVSGLGIGGGWAGVSICGRVGCGICALCAREVLAYVRGGMCCEFGCVVGVGLGGLVCGRWDWIISPCGSWGHICDMGTCQDECRS